MCFGYGAGVTSTDIYNKMERGKPGTIGLEIAEKLWGQSPERGARPMLYAATAPELNDPSKSLFSVGHAGPPGPRDLGFGDHGHWPCWKYFSTTVHLQTLALGYSV